MRTRRCLPRETTSSTRRPDRSTVAIRGIRKSVRVSTWPASARRIRVAARKTVSPSGTNAHAPRRRMEARLREGPGYRRVEHGLAVGALDLEPPELPLARDRRQRFRRRLDELLVVAVREQRPSAALDVEDEAAVHQDDRGAHLAPGTVAGILRAPVRPRQGGAVRVGRIRGGEDTHL